MRIPSAVALSDLARECMADIDGRKAKRQVLVHNGTCGIASGSKLVKSYLDEHLRGDGKVLIRDTSCCGACHQEPMVTVIEPDGSQVIYGDLTEDKLARIVQEHLVGGRPVKDLLTDGASPFFQKQVKRVTRLLGLIDPYDIREYIAWDGYQALAKVLSLPREKVIEEVTKSGLKGRGGAGFPTGLKWSFAAKAQGSPKYVICNADEGDPGAYMDRAIVEGCPHSVIEGLSIAAYAIGANKGYVYIRAEYPLAVEVLRNAITQARESGLLGANILGSGFDFEIEVCLGAGAFVCGEETGLIASIEGRRGSPRPRPPFPASQGLYGKPTVINNVKTLANVPLIFRNGAEWFSSLGTEKSKGTVIFSLTGKAKRSGLIEVPMGTTLGEVIFDIGGGVAAGKQFKAVQLGGPSGGCIPGKYLNTPIDYADIEALGAIMGSGGMIVMDEDSCMPDMARFFMEFTKDESCGKCTPCRAGIPQMLSILERVGSGRAELADLEVLEGLGKMIKECSLCGLGQTAPNPVLSTLRHFKDEYIAHIVDHRCHAAVCQSLFTAPCQHACPLGNDIPSIIALANEGRYEDAYLLIRQRNPLPSVCGRVCVRYCEGRCRRAQIDEHLSINHLLRFVTDYAIDKGVEYVPEMKERKKQKVAIVGSGPAGLSAAYDLALNGYGATVFEATSKPGGMMVWGIPAYRLPRAALEADLKVFRKMGIQIKLNSRVTDVESLLRMGYDAVFIASGLPKGRKMGIPGEELAGVHEGVDFLRRLNAGEKLQVGRSVAVVGGGNVAIDAARASLRLGARKVYIVYRRDKADMPAIPEEIEAAEEEGVQVLPLTNPMKIMSSNGRVSGVECARMSLSGFDDSCRKVPHEIEGSKMVLEVDTVIEAIGQAAENDFLQGKVTTDRQGLLLADERTLETNVPGIFAGGDAVTGALTVVEAIAAGQRGAHSIMSYLRSQAIPKRVTREIGLKIEIPKGEIKEEVPEEPHVKWATCPARERCSDFREVVHGYTTGEARKEAARCLRCDLES